MVGELQVPIVLAGAAALVAIDDLEQIPMQAGLIGQERFGKLTPYVIVNGAGL